MLLLLCAREQVDAHGVALEAVTADLRDADRRGDGEVAELLALFNVGDVDLHHRNGDGLDGVADGVAVVRVSAGVDDDAVEHPVRLLNGVDDRALVVGLEALDRDAAALGVGVDAGAEGGVVLAAVDIRLTLAEQVHVRAVDDQNFHGVFSSPSALICPAEQGTRGTPRSCGSKARCFPGRMPSACR